MTHVDLPPLTIDLMPIAALAKLKGVSKQAMWKRIMRLHGEGALALRQDGRQRLVSLAAYDAAVAAERGIAPVERLGSRETPPAATAGPQADAPETTALTAARTRKAELDAELLAMELARQRRIMVETAAVTQALEEAAARIASHIDEIPGWATDLVGIAHRSGTEGLRSDLRERSRKLRQAIATALGAAVTSPVLESTTADDDDSEEPRPG